MKFLKLKPINNSQRHTRLLEKSTLLKNSKFIKNLRKYINRCYGRSKTTGHITSWHKQRGSKFLYKPTIDHKKKTKSIVVGIDYNANCTALNSINFDLQRKLFFNDLCIKGITPGSLIKKNNRNNQIKLGFRVNISKLTNGAILSNIGLLKKYNTQYVKSAGTSAQLIKKDKKFVYLKLPSNKMLKITNSSLGTLGVISNHHNKNIIIGKAGRNRNNGRRPIVRGVAMNPVDHPHGGRTNGGRPSVSPWGIPTKNKFKLK